MILYGLCGQTKSLHCEARATGLVLSRDMTELFGGAKRTRTVGVPRSIQTLENSAFYQAGLKRVVLFSAPKNEENAEPSCKLERIGD